MTTFPVILDVAVGMVFIFLTLSAISSAINEVIARVTNARGAYLARGIQFLLWDQDLPKGAARFPILNRMGVAPGMEVEETGGLVGYILTHPLVRRLGTDYPKFPAYIPSSSFSLALLEGIRLGNPVARVEFLVQTYGSVVRTQENTALQNVLQPLRQALEGAMTDPAIKYVMSATRSGTITTSTLDALKNNLNARTALEAVDQGLEDVKFAAAAMQDVQARAAVLEFLDLVQSKEIRHQIESLPADYVNPNVKSTLIDLVEDADSGILKLEDIKKRIEDWFDEGMKRVSVLYKRYAQAILLAVGIVLCVVFNADALRILDSLWHDPTLRAVLVAEAQKVNQAAAPGTSAQPAGSGSTNVVQDSSSINSLLANLDGVPLGWNGSEIAKLVNDGSPDFGNIFRKLLGIALMSTGVGFGAPFWYDLLTKLVPLRADKTN